MSAKKYIFFRDDDVCRLDDKFLDFFHLFLQLKIPVTYGIIPSKMKPDLVVFLRRMKDRYPSLLALAQHGWQHANHNKNAATEEKYEFGPSRSYQDQKKDILSGWLKMRREFQDRFTPAFIPPFHGFDFTTLEIINELSEWKNFAMFSAGRKTFPKKKFFLDIPAEISHHPQTRKEQIIRALTERFRTQALCGILFHHENYGVRDLKNLEIFLKDIRSRPNIHPVLLSKVLGPVKSSKVHLTLALTNACNLKCRACRIWMEKPKKSLSFELIRKCVGELLESYDIASVSLTGGEPFVHPAFGKIFDFFHHLKMDGKISSLGIYSNGYRSDEIEEFLKKRERVLDGIDMGLSLDGLAKTHDFLRGKPGSFRSVDAVIAHIVKKYPVINVEAKFTISPFNIKDLWAVYKYSRRRRIRLSPKIVESHSPYYYHRADASQKCQNVSTGLDERALSETLDRIRRAQIKDRFETVPFIVLQALQEHLSGKKTSPVSCHTPLYSFFVTSSGDVHSCLNRGPLARIGSPGWLNKLRGPAFLDIAVESLNGRCPGCLAYHGLLSSVNMRGGGYA